MIENNLMMDQTKYEILKKQVQGFYFKFNTQVLRFYMGKMWDYEYLLETAKNFTTFSEFYQFHTQNKQDLVEKYVLMMYSEAIHKNLLCNPQVVRDCLVVRLGNIYNGMYTENKIINTFQTLSPYITCKKTEKEIDMLYKVDCIVELKGIDKLALQIKPISFKSYDSGSELSFHKQFKKEFGQSVYYILYKNKNEIVFNNVEVKLSDKEKIIEQIETILVYT